MVTRVSSVIRPKGSDLIFDHLYNAEYALLRAVLAIKNGLSSLAEHKDRKTQKL